MDGARRAARLPATFEILYAGAGREGSGTLVDISRFGALVAASRDQQPPVGAMLSLAIEASYDHTVKLDAIVVRLSPLGFAVEFSGATSIELLSLLESLGAS
jgi:hypothetical protein